jgi:hypothetical protein
MATHKRTIPEISDADKIRFWSNVNFQGSPDACWIWTKARSKTNPYGRFTINHEDFGPHCVAWTIVNGPIPKGFLLRHICDNFACVNPGHLLIGTDADNKKDSIERGTAVFPKTTLGKQMTREEWDEIRRRWPVETQSALAIEFGVTQGVISRIVNYQRSYL